MRSRAAEDCCPFGRVCVCACAWMVFFLSGHNKEPGYFCVGAFSCNGSCDTNCGQENRYLVLCIRVHGGVFVCVCAKSLFPLAFVVT